MAGRTYWDKKEKRAFHNFRNKINIQEAGNAIYQKEAEERGRKNMIRSKKIIPMNKEMDRLIAEGKSAEEIEQELVNSFPETAGNLASIKLTLNSGEVINKLKAQILYKIGKAKETRSANDDSGR